VSSDHEIQEWFAGGLVAAGAGVLALEMFVPQTNELLFLGLGLLMAGLAWMFVVGSRPLRIAAGLWLASIVTFLAAFMVSSPTTGPHVDGPRPVRTSEVLIVVSGILAIFALVQTVRTFRPWIAVALVAWMIGVGIPVIFRGGNVSTIIDCPNVGGSSCGPTDLPWEALWLAGTLAIIAIGSVSRKVS
jgi:hypothetical protein